MYASFRTVTAKNGKILTPTRTGNFWLTSMVPEFYATIINYCLVYHGAVIVSLGLQAAVTTFACDRVREEAMPAEVEAELQR